MSGSDHNARLRVLVHDLASPLQIITSCLEAMSYSLDQLVEVVAKADAAGQTELTAGVDRECFADVPAATTGARNGLEKLVHVLHELEELASQARKAA